MVVLNDIVGYRDRKIYQDSDCFSFSLDSILLANFLSIRKKDKHILDIGTGNAIIPLLLTLKTSANIIGVEIQKRLATLAEESVKYNELDKQVKIVNADINVFAVGDEIDKYDVVTCNPPYFKYTESSSVNLSPEKLIARHEYMINLTEVFFAASKLLKFGGNFALVHRPERLVEILELFQKNGIAPKKLQFVYERINKEAIAILIQGQKNGKSGLQVLRPFILYNSDGTETSEYRLAKGSIKDESKKL